jgi:hypothetical protein
MLPSMPSDPIRPPQFWPVAASALMAVSLALLQPGGGAAREFMLVATGFLAGFSLYHATFGFAGGWKRLILRGDADGFRAQLLLIALAVPAGHGLIAAGVASGWTVPVGVALVGGAFLFGMGMQLAGGCGSGTLFTAGGGSVRMMIVLAAFIAGSLIGTAPGLAGSGLPAFPALSFPEMIGPVPATLAAWVVLAALVLALPRPVLPGAGAPGPRELFLGPWPRWLGAVMLAGVVAATLAVAGRPWGITQAFALWGAKIAQAVGVEVASWPYWQGGRAGQLSAPILADATSVMDLSIIAGALAAAGLAGRFRPSFALDRRALVTAIAGGLMMGYGARLSSGCNIGALLGGITSGSLHGWIWFAAAFAGSACWLRLAAETPQNAPS